MRKRDLIMCKIDLRIYLEREIQSERERKGGRKRKRQKEREKEREKRAPEDAQKRRTDGQKRRTNIPVEPRVTFEGRIPEIRNSPYTDAASSAYVRERKYFTPTNFTCKVSKVSPKFFYLAL